MKKGNVIIIVVIAVLLVGGGAYALTRKDTPAKTPTTDTTQTTPDTTESTDSSTPDTTTPDTTETETATVITYSNNGFSPASVTVKMGSKITIKNSSSHTVQFNSNDHPTHTKNSEYNVGAIAAGSSAEITVTKTGTWGYHNHLDDSETGTIIVQ